MTEGRHTETEGSFLTFDFPAFKIGTASYEEDPTGCTVFLFPERVLATCDVRGGDPGVSEYQHGPERDLVSGAIVNDGHNRPNVRYPDKQLGQTAYHAAKTNRFPRGAVGAGRNVWVGGRRGRGVGKQEPAGQGGAFLPIGGVKIAVFTVVNALGAIIDRQGKVVCGNVDPQTGERVSYLKGLEKALADGETVSPSRANTTLTLVVTNQKLSPHGLRQVARQVHSSMARAIQPFHTIYDGDVLYMVTTSSVESERIDPVALGLLASEVAWDAILNSHNAPGRST